MSNSTLISTVVPAYKGNYTEGRTAKISEITIHHMSGKLTAGRCGELFQVIGRCGSSHYGIGYDGEIALYVDECNTAWTNSNWESNCRAVTIETSNSENKYPWAVSDKSLASLIKLVADIARRNGLGKLEKGKNLTWHRMYAATDCPGDYLLSKLDYIVAEANKINYPAPEDGTIDGIDTKRGDNQLIKYTKGKTTGTNNYGFEVAVDSVGVAMSRPAYKGNTAIPKGGYVLSGHGEAGKWLYGNIQKGYIVSTEGNKVTATRPKETNVSEGYITGINTGRGTNALVLITDGRAKTGFNKYGTDVIIRKADGVITKVIYGQANTPIPADCICLSGHGTNSKYLLENYKEGKHWAV